MTGEQVTELVAWLNVEYDTALDLREKHGQRSVELFTQWDSRMSMAVHVLNKLVEMGVISEQEAGS